MRLLIDFITAGLCSLEDQIATCHLCTFDHVFHVEHN
jgi:hypothetical protein